MIVILKPDNEILSEAIIEIHIVEYGDVSGGSFLKTDIRKEMMVLNVSSPNDNVRCPGISLVPAIEGEILTLGNAGGGNSRTQYLVTADIARRILGTPSNVNDPFSSIKRNAFRAPSVYTYDVSLIKRFYFTERVQVGLEVNAFNVFNRTNFGAPNGNLSSAFFGQVSGLAPGTTPRQLQFGLKLHF